MHHLKHTQKWAARFRGLVPQYWEDKLWDEALRRNQNLKGQVIGGKVLAIIRHHGLELEAVIPGLPTNLNQSLLQMVNGVLRIVSPAKSITPALNLVTNDGDVYYAQSAGGETPTDDFDGSGAGLRHGSDNTAATKTDTDVTTFLSGTGLVCDATYPTTADADSDNTGAGTDILTWRYSYGTSDGNATGIYEGAIVDDRTTPTAALTHYVYAASFDKTSSDTLKVFVNHEFLGV